MDFNYPLAKIRKSAKDIIVDQIQTGDVVKVKSDFLPIIFHYGIVCRETDKFIVYHNDPHRFNFFGGNVIQENFEEWIKGKDIVEVISTNLKSNNIQEAALKLKDQKYDVFNFNCEHFITRLKRQKPSSPQVIGWSIVLASVITAIIILRKKQ